MNHKSPLHHANFLSKRHFNAGGSAKKNSGLTPTLDAKDNEALERPTLTLSQHRRLTSKAVQEAKTAERNRIWNELKECGRADDAVMLRVFPQ